MREVKELVGREEARGEDEARPEGTFPAQKDLATGALLMFVGGVVAIFRGLMGPHWPAEMALPQTYFILGGTLAFILTLFHPMLAALEGHFSGRPANYTQRRRDGVNLGALLMFVGALKALLLTSLMPPGNEKGLTTLAFMAGMLLLVLLLRPILRAARGLFFKRDERADPAPADEAARLDPAQAAALPPAHSVPAGDFASARVDTAEMVAPPSVTEDATRKLSEL